MLNKMDILKFVFVFGKLMGFGRGLLSLQSLLTLKKGIRTFNFQSD
jgi:hypothetical protein